MDRYYVIGHPVGHSISPEIHLAFAQQTQQTIDYGSIDVPPGEVGTILPHLITDGARGFNVKYPLKQEAFAYADQRSPRAELAEAASCLAVMADGHVLAENFDGAAVINDLTQQHGIALKGKRILVAGAGNTTRIMLPELLAQQPGNVVLSNRTLAKAETLCDALALSDIDCRAYDTLTAPFDIIINTTSASLTNILLPIPTDCVGSHTVCYDVEYSPKGTVFTHWATAHGAAKAIDGFGMTIAHNALLFALWRDVTPDAQALFTTMSQTFHE